MPKAKVERVISDQGGWKTIEVDVTERNATKTARYVIPSSPADFFSLVSGHEGLTIKQLMDQLFGANVDERGKDLHATEETPLAFLHRMFVNAVDRKARADVYESLAQESTVITVAGERMDIMELPLIRQVRGVNGMRQRVDTGMYPAEVAAGKASDEAQKTKILEEARAAVEKSVGYGPWRTVAKKLIEAGKAKENEATGMLEAIAS